MKKSKLIRLLQVVKLVIGHNYKDDVPEPPVKFFNFLRKTRNAIQNEVGTIVESREEVEKAFIKRLRESGAMNSEHSARPLEIIDKKKYEELSSEFAGKFAEIDELGEEESSIKLERYADKTPEGVPMKYLIELADAEIIND